MRIGLLLLLAAFFHVVSPPMRDGAVDLILLRARDFLGQVPPGEGTPTFPGWATWIGFLLAATLWSAHLLTAGSVSLADFLLRTGPWQVALLRAIAALVAAGCVFLAAAVVRRLQHEVYRGRRLPSRNRHAYIHAPERRAPAQRGPEGAPAGDGTAAEPGLAGSGEDPRAGWSSPLRGRLGPIVLVAAFLLAPLLGDGVALVSPALLGGFLWLLLTERLLIDVRPGDLGWGAVSGVWLGVLLGACGWLWATVPVFLLVALLQRRGLGPVLAALVTGLGAGIALEPARLLDPSAVGPRLLTEWSRAGGWNVASVPLGSQGLVRMFTLAPVLGWGAVAGALVMLVLWIRARRFDLLAWWGGLGLVAVVLPAASGIRGLDLLQLTWAPVFLVAAAGAVGALEARGGSARSLAVILALVLILGAGFARVEGLRAPAAVSPEEIVRGVGEIVSAGALVLAERGVPGLDGAYDVYPLPRDSRRPDRYDFAYWPRWYSGFAYVLLSEVQVGQNAGRAAPLHFYGQLRGQGKLIARWGREGAGWLLYRIPEESDWRAPASPKELAALTVAPDLLPFVDQLGSFYARTGSLELALTLFQAGIGLDPSRGSLYNNLGSVYLLESEWEEAARVFEEGLRRDPRSAELCYNAGRAFFELGAYPRAEGLFRRAVGLRPDFADAHYELARTFLAQDRTDGARMALEQVLSLGPSPERRAAVESVLEQLPPSRSGGPSGTGGAR